jgi:hypothetical protein
MTTIEHEPLAIDAPPSGWGYQSLLMRQIRRDGGTQARVGLNEDTVQEYAELMREHRWDFQTMQRPIVLFDGESFWLADGFHRIEAAQRAGLSDYPIEVLRGSQRDAVLRAAGANSQHGLRRSNEDKRRAVELLLRDAEWRQWSDRKIADVCAVSNKFVGDVRRALSVNGTQIPETRTVERNGTSYQMTPAAPQRGAINRPDGSPSNGAQPVACGQCGGPWGAQGSLIAGSAGFICATCAKTNERAPAPEIAPAAPPVELPIETDDDQAMIAAIRSLAEPLDLQMVWEDGKVLLYWRGEEDEIDQMDMLSYGAALEWLTWEAKGIKQDMAPIEAPAAPIDPAASDRVAYEAKEFRDKGLLFIARAYIASGDIAQARSALDGIEVSTWERDQLLATIPVGRRVEIELTADDCAALLKEARVFASGDLTKKLPAIGQVLIVLIEAIKR